MRIQSLGNSYSRRVASVLSVVVNDLSAIFTFHCLIAMLSLVFSQQTCMCVKKVVTVFMAMQFDTCRKCVRCYIQLSSGMTFSKLLITANRIFTTLQVIRQHQVFIASRKRRLLRLQCPRLCKWSLQTLGKVKTMAVC